VEEHARRLLPGYLALVRNAGDELGGGVFLMTFARLFHDERVLRALHVGLLKSH
jgi:hypothetical protein